MAINTDAVVRQTVRALRESQPAGLADCAAEGNSIRVIETVDNRTYTVTLPPKANHSDDAGNPWSPEPGSVTYFVVTEFYRQRLRLETAKARADAATIGTADQGRPVVVSVESDDGGRLHVHIAQPWTRAQLDALRRLEKQRAAQVQLEELARGPQPPEVDVIVFVDETGHVDLDRLTADPEIRGAVLEALTEQDEQDTHTETPPQPGGAP